MWTSAAGGPICAAIGVALNLGFVAVEAAFGILGGGIYFFRSTNMGVARDEVQPWHRAGMAAAPPERSKAISNLFLPPAASASWVKLEADQRRLSGVRLMESAHPGEESQAIALLIREALEVPERRVALITPDRELAARVIAQLERWGINADDTAGEPLPQTLAGRLLLQLAEVAGSGCAPVPLLALLGHPHAGEAFGRADWLDHVQIGRAHV